MRWNKTGLLISALMITGCATASPALETHSVNFGNAISQNIAAQRIAPSAEEKANTYIPPNRARQKAARESYESGTVTEPVAVGTTGDE